MALQPRNLLVDATEAAKLRIWPDRVQPKTFAEDAGASEVVLPIGTLVSYNVTSDLWVPWVTGVRTANNGVIRGIVVGAPITIKATSGGEVVGNVMVGGRAHYADCSSLAGTEADRIAAMRKAPLQVTTSHENPSPRELGLQFEGLTEIR